MPSNTALIIVDMQNCFAHEDGSLYSPASEEIIAELSNFAERARQNGAKVVYTKDTHTEEQFEELDHYDEFSRWGEHALKDTWEHEIVEELQPAEEDMVIEKGKYDAFHQTSLDNKLEEDGVETVVVVGTLANVCVLHTASSAALNDYEAIVVEDLVGYLEEEDKEYALNHVDWLFGETKPAGNVDF